MKKFYHKGPLLISCILLLACTGCILKEPVIFGKNAIKQLDVEQLMGSWHEVAQSGRPERKMIAAVNIETSINDKGIIRLDIKKNKFTPYGPYTEVRGIAKWNPDYPGILKCSLYMNFFREYYILYLDPDNTTTLICNRAATRFWVFSKHMSLSENQIAGIIQKMESVGFDPDKLIWHPAYF